MELEKIRQRSLKGTMDAPLSLPTYSVVDLFCGCGGLSRGFERTGRFRTALGIDLHKASLETFVANHGSADLRPVGILKDIRNVTPDEIWKALRLRGITRPRDLDCLVGGPPCEGFSRNKVYSGPSSVASDEVAEITYEEEKYWKAAWSGSAGSSETNGKGRAVRAYNPFLNDPRNFLFRSFLDIAGELMPKIIVIENVQQMLRHSNGSVPVEVFERLERLNYRAECRVLNAADYGVPQLRKRVFFLALRKDIASSIRLPWPEASHSAKIGSEASQTLLSGGSADYVTVRDAIGDLPQQRPEKTDDGAPQIEPIEYPDAELSEFRKFVRSTAGVPRNNFYRTPSEQVIAKLRAMRPGMKAHHLPQALQTKKYYYNAYGRLEWDKPANTITKSFIYPGSGKFGHPEAPRVISYREAARLQSFDDDFTFFGSSQEAISHMIGSAVPPRLGFAFGLSIASVLDQIGKVLSTNRRRKAG